MKCHAQLGPLWFEELQMMKFTWRNNIGELATWNSAQVEVVDDEMKEYSDLLIGDKEQEGWDNIVDVEESLFM